MQRPAPCAGGVVDSVTYGVVNPWPSRVPGRAIQIDGAADGTSATANDLPGSWCTATTPFDGGDFGSPGEVNPPCPAPIPVGWCRLQHPPAITTDVDTPISVFGWVYQAGQTDITVDTNDPAPLILAEVAYGPLAIDPQVAPEAWTYIPAAPNDAAVPTGDNDEYAATFLAPAAGLYAFATRFSADGGISWTWCDLDAGPGMDGSEDGFGLANAGALTTLNPNACDPNPCVTPEASTCDGDVLHILVPEGVCTEVGDAFSCAYAETIVDCAGLGGSCDPGGPTCTGTAPAPAIGDVIVTEIMADPTSADDPNGEWFELTNTTAATLSLAACVVSDGEGEVPLDYLLLGPGEAVVLAYSAPVSGVDVDFVYGGKSTSGSPLTLANSGDELSLVCGADTITSLAYGASAPWPAPVPGTAIQLHPGAEDVTAGGMWCGAQTSFNASELGTPGDPNPPCVELVVVDWCRLQHPPVISEPAGTEVSIFGRVWVEGLTDQTTGVDVDADLTAQGGWGDPAADPATWTWQGASPTPDFDGSVWNEDDNDQYELSFLVPAVGSYAYAFRFSLNAGASWVYCDLDTEAAGEDGSEDGFQIDNAGALTSTDPSGLCSPNPCTMPPADGCDGQTLTVYPAEGSCSVSELVVACGYVPTTTDCAALGGTCDSASLSCDVGAPPAPGEVIVNEIHYNPTSPGDPGGEYVELRNLTGGALNLTGCALTDGEGAATFGPLAIEAEGYLVLAHSDNFATVGWTPDFVYGAASPSGGGIQLNNSNDDASLVCGEIVIDAVAYADKAPFPKESAGASIQLDPGDGDPGANDLGPSWCVSTAAFDGGDLGTPGAANTPCERVDWCKLNWPVTPDPPATTTAPFDVFVLLYEAGITDQTTGTDGDPSIEVQVGYAVAGANPTVSDVAWTWVDAGVNGAWVDTEAPLNDDEYFGALLIPTAGDYHYAGRVTVDGGSTWRYCDLDGSDDGYSPAQAGTATVTAP